MSSVSPAKPLPKLTRKDFTSDQEVRWCPGCGDYAILAAVQKLMPDLGIPREKTVFVSGIGCSSRFPYYMNTYGFHTIHGRAPSIATGLKCANPDLTVWVVTGDGDGLSIGGNHLLHAVRRNVDLKMLLFNNRIYGLTKGQYSPTSEQGKTTKSTPMGSLERPINPLRFAIASEATFVARTYDTDLKHMATVLEAAARHKGMAFVEILQNCVIFNDGAFQSHVDKKVRDDQLVYLEHGKPLIYGAQKNHGVRMKGFGLEFVSWAPGATPPDDLLVHDVHAAASYSYLLTELESPLAVGVFRAVQAPTYDALMNQQMSAARQKKGEGRLEDLYREGASLWTVGAHGGNGSAGNGR
ncbi:MAG: 2-oxoacid:ferredoxin oxidoreductase subunit beta [Planctomycetes bacterium]|nr:2-oxoacid:ferredoxin oxidoreductase subunit beta [Planctomycetota bacterium]